MRPVGELPIPRLTATVLPAIGRAPREVVTSIRTGGMPTHWVCGSRKPRARRGAGGVCPPGMKFCSSAQRRRTPPAFAAWLVAMARSVTRDQAELALEVG